MTMKVEYLSATWTRESSMIIMEVHTACCVMWMSCLINYTFEQYGRNMTFVNMKYFIYFPSWFRPCQEEEEEEEEEEGSELISLDGGSIRDRTTTAAENIPKLHKP